MRVYFLRALLSGPMFFIVLPVMYFRYYTLRYRFDDEGVAASWGILFRREVNLTYARIQDIHINAGFVQRWLGLADVLVQTASGSAGAELTIEGLLEYQSVRDFLYRRMRGVKDEPAPTAAQRAADDEVVQLLRGIQGDLAAVRAELQRRPPEARS